MSYEVRNGLGQKIYEGDKINKQIAFASACANETGNKDFKVCLVCCKEFVSSDGTVKYQKSIEWESFEQMQAEHAWMKAFLIQAGELHERDGELCLKTTFVDEENDIREERYNKINDTFEAKLFGGLTLMQKNAHGNMQKHLLETGDLIQSEDGCIKWKHTGRNVGAVPTEGSN